MEKKDRLVLKTIGVWFVLLLFMFVQGAIVVIGQIDGVPSALIRGAVIWASAIVAILVYYINHRELRSLGFTKAEKGAAGKMLYFVPLLIICFSHFVAGIELGEGLSLVLAYLFFTLAIGVAEETYFRGLICNMWLKKGINRAVMVSAILFGVSHMMNVAGGAGLFETMLQICFAFFYGTVIAYVFVIGKSLIPCILLHSLHDFCSFMSGELSQTANTFLGAVQVVILIAYGIYLYKTQIAGTVKT
ncbi:MAG: CPBP family intramembrane metalloprotease [Eubacteriales bacterium]|nr:CPBP family intramembrane metalloprotease [Eubacteriales bacterium]